MQPIISHFDPFKYLRRHDIIILIMVIITLYIESDLHFIRVYYEVRLSVGCRDWICDASCDVIQGALRCPSVDQECPHLMTMNSTLHQLLSVWLALGGLQLERITWQTPCDLLQKVRPSTCIAWFNWPLARPAFVLQSSDSVARAICESSGVWLQPDYYKPAPINVCMCIYSQGLD